MRFNRGRSRIVESMKYFIAPDFGVSIEKYGKQIGNELPAVALGQWATEAVMSIFRSVKSPLE